MISIVGAHEYRCLENLSLRRHPCKSRPDSPLSNYYCNLHVTTQRTFSKYLAKFSTFPSASFSNFFRILCQELISSLEYAHGRQARICFVVAYRQSRCAAPPHQLLSYHIYHHPEPSLRPRLRIPPVGPVCYAQSSPMGVRTTMTGDLLDKWHPLLCKIGYRRRCGDLLCGVPGRRSLYQIQKQN